MMYDVDTMPSLMLCLDHLDTCSNFEKLHDFTRAARAGSIKSLKSNVIIVKQMSANESLSYTAGQLLIEKIRYLNIDSTDNL